MHIEAGVVQGTKLLLSYASAAAVLVVAAKMTVDTVKANGLISLIGKSVFATLGVFVFFEVLPHYPVGVSEVHFILGSTLFLLFGAAPAAIGLAAGLLLQGLLLAPFDLPQYGINLTTLLMPLFALTLLANRIIPEDTPYKDLSYAQAFKLSVAYQGGVIAWVAFWALYGQGFGAENLVQVMAFCSAYALVVLVEPVIDLGVLALAKGVSRLQESPFVERRLYHAQL
ncbi:MAG: energy-coupling factor ABC transporter permease [Arenicella sp.]